MRVIKKGIAETINNTDILQLYIDTRVDPANITDAIKQMLLRCLKSVLTDQRIEDLYEQLKTNPNDVASPINDAIEAVLKEIMTDTKLMDFYYEEKVAGARAKEMKEKLDLVRSVPKARGEWKDEMPGEEVQDIVRKVVYDVIKKTDHLKTVADYWNDRDDVLEVDPDHDDPRYTDLDDAKPQPSLDQLAMEKLRIDPKYVPPADTAVDKEFADGTWADSEAKRTKLEKKAHFIEYSHVDRTALEEKDEEGDVMMKSAAEEAADVVDSILSSGIEGSEDDDEVGAVEDDDDDGRMDLARDEADIRANICRKEDEEQVLKSLYPPVKDFSTEFGLPEDELMDEDEELFVSKPDPENMLDYSDPEDQANEATESIIIKDVSTYRHVNGTDGIWRDVPVELTEA